MPQVQSHRFSVEEGIYSTVSALPEALLVLQLGLFTDVEPDGSCNHGSPLLLLFLRFVMSQRVNPAGSVTFSSHAFMKENGHTRVGKHKDAIAYGDLSKIMNVYRNSLLQFLLRFVGKENVRSLLCPFWCFCSLWIIVTFFLLVNFYLP